MTTHETLVKRHPYTSRPEIPQPDHAAIAAALEPFSQVVRDHFRRVALIRPDRIAHAECHDPIVQSAQMILSRIAHNEWRTANQLAARVTEDAIRSAFADASSEVTL